MLPAWATVLVAIVGSALAGVVVGILRNRYERVEAFRDRMLNAADDLATGLAQALLVVRHAVGELEDYLVEHKQPVGRGDLTEGQRLIDEATARIARVELLFGVGSAVADTANSVVTELRRAVATLETDGVPHLILDQAGKHYQCASTAYREFSVAAREGIADHRR